jgi:hypothetical protein
MARRGRYGAVDPRSPEAAGVCDRGGEVVKRSELMPEMRWAGDRLVPTGFLCCARHIDRPNPQDRPLRLSADPVPVADPRPFIPFEPVLSPDALLDGVGAPLLDRFGEPILAPASGALATALVDDAGSVLVDDAASPLLL